MFNKVLPQPSELLLVTLPRPMGVVIEYDQQKKRAVVADVVERSAAEQKQKVAGLNPGLAKESVQTGESYCTRTLFAAVSMSSFAEFGKDLAVACLVDVGRV